MPQKSKNKTKNKKNPKSEPKNNSKPLSKTQNNKKIQNIPLKNQQDNKKNFNDKNLTLKPKQNQSLSYQQNKSQSQSKKLKQRSKSKKAQERKKSKSQKVNQQKKQANQQKKQILRKTNKNQQKNTGEKNLNKQQNDLQQSKKQKSINKKSAKNTDKKKSRKNAFFQGQFKQSDRQQMSLIQWQEKLRQQEQKEINKGSIESEISNEDDQDIDRDFRIMLDQIENQIIQEKEQAKRRLKQKQQTIKRLNKISNYYDDEDDDIAHGRKKSTKLNNKRKSNKINYKNNNNNQYHKENYQQNNIIFEKPTNEQIVRAIFYPHLSNQLKQKEKEKATNFIEHIVDQQQLSQLITKTNLIKDKIMSNNRPRRKRLQRRVQFKDKVSFKQQNAFAQVQRIILQGGIVPILLPEWGVGKGDSQNLNRNCTDVREWQREGLGFENKKLASNNIHKQQHQQKINLNHQEKQQYQHNYETQGPGVFYQRAITAQDFHPYYNNGLMYIYEYLPKHYNPIEEFQQLGNLIESNSLSVYYLSRYFYKNFDETKLVFTQSAQFDKVYQSELMEVFECVFPEVKLRYRKEQQELYIRGWEDYGIGDGFMEGQKQMRNKREEQYQERQEHDQDQQKDILNGQEEKQQQQETKSLDGDRNINKNLKEIKKKNKGNGKRGEEKGKINSAYILQKEWMRMFNRVYKEYQQLNTSGVQQTHPQEYKQYPQEQQQQHQYQHQQLQLIQEQYVDQVSQRVDEKVMTEKWIHREDINAVDVYCYQSAQPQRPEQIISINTPVRKNKLTTDRHKNEHNKQNKYDANQQPYQQSSRQDQQMNQLQMQTPPSCQVDDYYKQISTILKSKRTKKTQTLNSNSQQHLKYHPQKYSQQQQTIQYLDQQKKKQTQQKKKQTQTLLQLEILEENLRKGKYQTQIQSNNLNQNRSSNNNLKSNLKQSRKTKSKHKGKSKSRRKRLNQSMIELRKKVDLTQTSSSEDENYNKNHQEQL